MKKFLTVLAAFCVLANAAENNNNISQNHFAGLLKNIEKAQKQNEATLFQSLSKTRMAIGDQQKMITLMKEESNFKKIAANHIHEKQKLNNFFKQSMQLKQKQLLLTEATTAYKHKMVDAVIKPLEADLDALLARNKHIKIQDTTRENTMTGSFLELLPSKDEEVADSNNEYKGNKRFTTQMRSLEINSTGQLNKKLDTAEKIIETKKRNGDISYKNDIKELQSMTQKANAAEKKAALSTGVFSPLIEEHRNLLDCIRIENPQTHKHEFVGIKSMGQQLYSTFNAQHADLRQMLPAEKTQSKEYRDLSAKFAEDYRICVNDPLKYPHIEAATYNRFKPTTDKITFIKQYADWFKAQTKFFVGAIKQKMEEVKEGNLSVTGLTEPHTDILAYVASNKKSHSAINNS